MAIPNAYAVIRTFCSNLVRRGVGGSALIHCLLIISLGLAIYANTFQVPFLLDDLPCIVENPAISSFTDRSIPPDQRYAGMEPDIINSMHLRAVTYLTFALNYRIHGLHITGYHVVNLLIHLATALLVYAVVTTLLMTPFFSDHPECRSYQSTLPLLTALLFVAHPIQTTAVTYIVQRFAILAALFYLLSLLLYLRARTAEASRSQKAWLAGSVSIAVLGMYTKETVFTLPLMVLLCECLFLRGGPGRRIRYLSPLACTMLIIPLNMISLSDVAGGVEETLQSSTNLANLTEVSRWDYFCTQFRVIVTYLRLLVLPINQQLDYDYPRFHSLLAPPVPASILFLAGICASGIWAGLRSRLTTPASGPLRLFAFGVAWFFITLAPSSSIIPLDDMIFEYHLYLPSVGFFLAVVALALLARQSLEETGLWPVRGVTAGVVIVVMSLAVATFSRNHVWGTAVRFWEDGVAKAPNKARVHHNLGTAYKDACRFTDAIAQNYIAINSSETRHLNYLSWHNIGLCLTNLKRYAEALEAYKKALELDDDDYITRLRYAELLGVLGRINESKEQFRLAEELQ